jgi:hypothetical protein
MPGSTLTQLELAQLCDEPQWLDTAKAAENRMGKRQEIGREFPRNSLVQVVSGRPRPALSGALTNTRRHVQSRRTTITINVPAK